MKILFISLMEGDPWGGSEELWYNVAKYALAEGVTVHFSSLRWDRTPDKLQELINSGAIPHFRKYPGIEIAKKIYRQLKSIFPIGNWSFVTDDFDHILISFGGPYDLLDEKKLHSILAGKKLSYSIIQQFNYDNYFLDDKNRALVKAFLTIAKHVFFVSERNRESTERNIVTRLHNSVLVSNPANIPDISEEIPFPGSIKPTFACVARLDIKLKHQDLLISAFSGPEWKDRDFKLNLYGKGTGENYLKELISFYNLEDKIEIKGHVPDIRQVWAENHIMVLPSSAEGSPLSIIEAMYCSRPIIASDVAGNTALFDEKSGFIINRINVKSIGKALNRAWEERNNWEEMGLNASKHIRSIHDRDSHKKIFSKISFP
ncbi:MAG: glycosyltransferase [Bacteroidota bacterium]|jgi:glycosyltransferase involved in cell wall biosynthesis